jgi:hypothetical protein
MTNKTKNYMKKIILFSVLLLNLNYVLKAQYVNVEISKMTVIIAKKDTVLGNNTQVILKNNSSKEEITLFSSNNLTIKATYKVYTNSGVRRSNLKKSAVNVEVNYTFIHKGKKNKVKTERIFYLDDDKKFEEEQTAIFKEGINNKLIKIKYECVLN